jgi:putative ABC transport system permease protein
VMVSNPPGMGASGWRFETAGKLIPEAERRPAVSGVVATKGYLRLLGLNLLRGRDFEDTDGLPGKESVIVSVPFAARFFPNQDPIGKQIRIYDDENKPRPWMTIVGLMPNIRQRDPTSPSEDPLILVPYRFQSYSSMAVLIRTQGSPSALSSALRREVQQLDPDLPLFDVGSLEEQFARQRWHLRVFGTLFSIFAFVAMGMAAVGIYAVMSHAAGLRTREIGVRMALGAEMNAILRLVLSRGVKQLAIGITFGLASGLAVCRLMGRLLFNVSPNDPLTFALVVATLGAAGLAATWLPARKAARIDPVKALQYE